MVNTNGGKNKLESKIKEKELSRKKEIGGWEGREREKERRKRGEEERK